MTDMCRKAPKNSQCDTTDLTNSSQKECAPFEACLPFGGKLSYDGDCMSFTRSSSIPDGRYGIIVVQDNCIVSAEPAPVFEYTPPSCTPASNPCGGSSGSGVVLQTNPCNLLSFDAAGRLGAYLEVEAGSGITLTGCGKTPSKLIISATPQEQSRTYIMPGTPDIIPITGSGTSTADPYIVSHAESPLQGESYGGFTIDAYGHITGLYSDGQTYIQSVIAGPGIEVNVEGPIATISLAASPLAPQTSLLGGYNLSTDISGRVTAIDRAITITAGTIDPLYNSITVNAFGSITGTAPIQRMVDDKFSKYFDGERETTTMEFTTTFNGNFRISYTGDLGTYSGTGDANQGLVPITNPYRVEVNGQVIPSYVRVLGNRIVEVQVVSYGVYAAGTHTVELIGPAVTDEAPYPFYDYSMMDVFVTRGV